MRSSSWPLPRGGAFGITCSVFWWLSFQERGWGGLCFRHGLCGDDSGLLGLWASLYRPNQRETIVMGDCYILCGRSGVTWSAWAALRQRCEQFLFAAGCSMKELSKTTGSGCRCHGCAGSRSRNGLFCVPWPRCSRAVAPSLLWEELCCHPGGGARVWLSRSALHGSYLGAFAHRCLASFHRFGVVAAQALVCSGPARLDISLLTSWSLVLGPGFLVSSPTLRHIPMGCRGWGFVYVSTFWNVVCLISWKYWITFLQNLLFFLSNVWFFLFLSS